MNRGELIREMADLFGKPKISVEFLDRTLAKTGVREKTRRGRGAPDVSSADIVNLAIGLASDRTHVGTAEFVREVRRLQLSEPDPSRAAPDNSDPHISIKFGPEFEALIERAPGMSDLIDMEVQLSLTRPEAQVRITRRDGVSMYRFQDPNSRSDELTFESYVTFSNESLKRLIAIRHGYFEMPYLMAEKPQICENQDDMVCPAGFEPTT